MYCIILESSALFVCVLIYIFFLTNLYFKTTLRNLRWWSNREYVTKVRKDSTFLSWIERNFCFWVKCIIRLCPSIYFLINLHLKTTNFRNRLKCRIRVTFLHLLGIFFSSQLIITIDFMSWAPSYNYGKVKFDLQKLWFYFLLKWLVFRARFRLRYGISIHLF